MSVTNVYHRTRDLIYKMNFSSSGETAWSFTAESDGEIYAVESNNVDSYTINGVARTLPFTLNAGNSYAIVITKTNAGQSADITLKSRRAVNKTITKDVPDFNIGDGRYLYALSKVSNKVYKLDVSLLVKSNYEGSGVWTTNPVVSEIDLPVINDTEGSGGWSDLCYLTSTDIFVYGWSASEYSLYGCLISTSGADADTVYNLDKSSIGQASILSSMKHTHHKRDPNGIYYDFINNHLYAQYNGVYWSTLCYDVNNLFSYLGNTPGSQTADVNQIKLWFDPVEEHFVGMSDFVFRPEFRRFNSIYYNQFVYNCVVDRETNYRWKANNNSYSRLYSFDNFGTIVHAIVNDSAGVGAGSFLSFSQKFGTIVCYGDKKFFSANTRANIGKSWPVQNPVSGQNKVRDAFGSDYNGNHFFIDNSTSQRLFVIDFETSDYSDTENPQFGYLDLSSAITCLYGNQIM